MTGEIIYSYPISRAVEKGYVKRINGYRLNPSTLTTSAVSGKAKWR